MRIFFCTAVGAFLAAAPALANDSSAALGAGGLVLTQNANIRMASEDLYVSPTDIRIRYEFVNDGASDIDTIVAFPLPDIDAGEFFEEPVGTMTDDPANFVGFTVRQDGQPVAVGMEQRALLKGRDVTAALKSRGVPVNIIHQKYIQGFAKLKPALRAGLIAAHLAEGDAEYQRPLWTIATKFYWRQHFPHRKTVVLEQSYHPVTGQSFFSGTSLAAGDSDERKQFCIDAPTQSAIRKRLAAKKNDPNGDLLIAHTTDYILQTAKNWRGPIGNFHLTLDKGKPANILSVCWDGNLRKTSPTRFEASETNFVPKRDLSVLVLE